MSEHTPQAESDEDADQEQDGLPKIFHDGESIAGKKDGQGGSCL
jgi:hypothetical protein